MHHKIMLFAFLSFSACFSSPTPIKKSMYPPVSGQCTDGDHQIKTITYNLGLARGLIPNSEKRLPLIIDAVKKADPDILCIQEAWDENDITALIGALSHGEEYTFRKDTCGLNEDANDVCEELEVAPLFACADEHCANANRDQLASCMVKLCAVPAIGLSVRSPGCLRCIIATVGKEKDEAKNICITSGASRGYDGQNGVLLLSKFPLTNREAIELPSSGANRVALIATVDIPDIGPVEVGCTHLSSNPGVGILPTIKEYSTWEDEQIAQFTILSNRIKQRSKKNPLLILADINTSPKIKGNVNDAATPVWKTVTNLGWRSPATEVEESFCSMCPENPLRNSRYGYLIDHVLIQPANNQKLTATCAEAMFKDIYGDFFEKKYTMSDHYGLKVQFKKAAAIPTK
jgi:endonuclease/exonuclease/phosphatase family metal-dependent hydrolase